MSEFVVDRSFSMFFRNPATHEAALQLLADTFRRLHALPIPAGAGGRKPHEFLALGWQELEARGGVPGFAADLVRRALDAPIPDDGRAPVLSHNDPNPTNMVFDGTRLVLLDWDAAGPMHPFYDLAAVAVFLRFDDGIVRRLLSAYTGAPVAEVPEVFRALRRLIGVLCGMMMLRLARLAGHPGDAAATLDTTLALGDFYARLMTGAVNVGSPDGQWQFGLALFKESAGA